jgi:MurNAc alpha-1-phosphate uridylyltransferase
MVLAAGLGTRMRPLTNTTPKPLVRVAGRTLLDRAIDRLEEAGAEEVVVNVHHLAEQVEMHLQRRTSPTIRISREPQRLETGGGVVNALRFLGEGPFFVVNADVIWLNGPYPALARLAATWDDRHMDGLLLIHPTIDAFGYDGIGDFLMDQVGRLSRRPEAHLAPYLFTGVQVLHRRLFANVEITAFSLNLLYDRAIETGRLYAVLHDGKWLHVGTPTDIQVAESYLARHFPGTGQK